jgi:hypothetical protein
MAIVLRWQQCSGRKITASFGNVTVRAEKDVKGMGMGGSKMAKSLYEHVQYN